MIIRASPPRKRKYPHPTTALIAPQNGPAQARSLKDVGPTGEHKAQRILREELQRLGWAKADLPQRRKGDPGKVVAARRLRQETTMSLKWIAQRLSMGSWTYVSNLLKEKS